MSTDGLLTTEDGSDAFETEDGTDQYVTEGETASIGTLYAIAWDQVSPTEQIKFDGFTTRELGQTVQLYAQFRDQGNGVAADPSGFAITTLDPTGAATVYTFGADGSPLVRVSVGLYRMPLTPQLPHLWSYRVLSTDPQPAARERRMMVRKARATS